MRRSTTVGLAALLAVLLDLPVAGGSPPEPADTWSHLPRLRLATPDACEATAVELEVERRRDGGFAILQRLDVAACRGALAVDWPEEGSFEPTMLIHRDGQTGFVASVPCGERLCFGGELADSTLELRFDVRGAPDGLSLVPEVADWGSLPEVQLTFAGRHQPTAVAVWQEAGSWQDKLTLESGAALRLTPRAGDLIGVVFGDRFTPRGSGVRPTRLPAGPPDTTLAIIEDSGVRRFAGEYRRGRRHGPWTWHHEGIPAEREVVFDDGVLVSMGEWTYGAWQGMHGERIAHPDLVDCPEGSLLEGEREGDQIHQWCRWTGDEGEVQGGPWTTWQLPGGRVRQRTVVDGELHGVLTRWLDTYLEGHAMFRRGEPVGEELFFAVGRLQRRLIHGPPVPGRDAASWYPLGRKERLHQRVAGMGDRQRTLLWFPSGALCQHCEPLDAHESWCWRYRQDGSLERSGPQLSDGSIDPSDRTPPPITSRPVVLPDVIQLRLDDVPATVLEASAATRAVGATGAKPSLVYVTDLDRDGQVDWLVRYADAFANVLLGGQPELVDAGLVLRVVDLHLRPEPGGGMSPICGMQGAGPDGITYFCHDFEQGRYDMNGYPAGLAEPWPWRASCDDFGDCELLVHAGGTVWRSDVDWAGAVVDCPGDGPCVPRSGDDPARASGDLQCSQDGDLLACVLTHEAHLHLQRGWIVDLSTGEVQELPLPSGQAVTGELVRVVGAPRWIDGAIELTIDDEGQLRDERLVIDPPSTRLHPR